MPDTIRGDLTVGTVLTYIRRYAPEEVAVFRELSGGTTPEGTLPDLLVIAPLTKLGGDIDYLSRRMTWTAHRPVAADEEIRAELEITAVEPAGPALQIHFAARIRDRSGAIVLSGTSKGMIPAVT